ncbi:MAG: AAA family ATPase [Candidatus Limnocylindrales bacterium]
MTRLRLRPSTGAVRGQTRAYAERVDELVALLRREIGAPAEARGGPALVVLMGVPGVGKSHCARLIGARLGAAHIATDQLRSRLFIAASYAEEENATIFRCVEALVDQLLGEGHRVIVDATNLIARNRKATVAVARRHRVPLVFVRVVADEAAILARLDRRRTARSADDHSDADVRVYKRMKERSFEPPEGGHLELQNGTGLPGEIERIARAVEQACASAS